MHVLYIKAVSHGQKTVYQLPMLAFSGFCLPVQHISQFFLQLTVSPGFIVCQLYTSFYRTVLCVIIRVGSSSASIHFSLQPALFLLYALHLICQFYKIRPSFCRICKGLGPYIYATAPFPVGCRGNPLTGSSFTTGFPSKDNCAYQRSLCFPGLRRIRTYFIRRISISFS